MFERQLFGSFPARNEHYAEWRRAWRIFGYRNSNGDKYWLCLTRMVKSDSACGWSYDQKRVRVPALTWRTAYRFRRFGALKLYPLQQKALRRFAR